MKIGFYDRYTQVSFSQYLSHLKFYSFAAMKSHTAPYAGWLTLLFLGAVWGSAFILIKKALNSYTGAELAGFRIFLSGVFLIPFVLSQLKLVRFNDLGWLILSGLFGNAIPAFMFSYAQQGLDSAFSGLLNSTTPIFTLLLGVSIFQTPANKISVLGVFIGLAGTAYLLFSYHDEGGGGTLFHSLLALGGSFCYGVSLNIIKKKLPHLPSILITGFPFILTSSIALIALLATGSFAKALSTTDTRTDFMYIVLLALFATSIGVFVFNLLIKKTSALFASTVTYLIPAFSVLWGMIDGETVGLFYFIGIAIILSGIWLVNLGNTRLHPPK